MLGPEFHQRAFAMCVFIIVLSWVLTPWLGLMAFLYVPLFVFFVVVGLFAVWTIDEWLRELSEGRESRRGGVR